MIYGAKTFQQGDRTIISVPTEELEMEHLNNLTAAARKEMERSQAAHQRRQALTRAGYKPNPRRLMIRRILRGGAVWALGCGCLAGLAVLGMVDLEAAAVLGALWSMGAGVWLGNALN